MTSEPGAKVIKVMGFEARYNDVAFLSICFAFIYLNLFILPGTPIFYEMDHVALLNDAKRMIEGDVIYRDFFEFTFPGSHLLYFTFESLLGPKYLVSSILILLHGMAAAILGLVIGRRIIADNIYAYLPPTIYIFLGFRWFGIDGEHRMFSPLFALLAVFFLLEKKTYGRIAAAGLSCALSSFFTQQRGILTVIAIGIFLLFEIGLQKRQWLLFLKSSLLLGATFGGSLFLLLFPFIWAAGPERFYESTFLFISSYVKDPTENSMQSYLSSMFKISSLGLLMTVVAVFYSLLVPAVYAFNLAILWLKRKNLEVLHKKGIFLVTLLGILLTIGTFAPTASRIYQIALPAVIVLTWCLYNLKFRSNALIGGMIASLIVFGFVLAFRLQTVWDVTTLSTPSGRIAFTSPVVLERYQWLSDNAVPGDLVYETYNSHVNFPLNLRNPSFISVLLNSGYSPPEQVIQAIEDLKRTKARYIIWDGAWNDEMPILADNEKLKPFYLYMIANYRLQKSFSPYDGRNREIWERVGDGLK